MALTFFEGATGRIHRRHWPVDEPRAGVVFAHGFGQHTGHYHRFAAALAREHIEMWGLDLAGHGLSEGVQGVAGEVTDHAADIATLTEIAARSQRPLVVMGHSLGAASVLAALPEVGPHCVGVVLCGTPRNAASTGTARLIRDSGLPVLVVHGVDDRLAPIEPVRHWVASVAESVRGGRGPSAVELREYTDAGHDLLHEPVHRTVTADVAAFVLHVAGV